MLGKFTNETTARNFSNKTIKASAIILGDDGYFWVVTLAEMSRLIAAGYEVI